jgi:hypothetical protein
MSPLFFFYFILFMFRNMLVVLVFQYLSFELFKSNIDSGKIFFINLFRLLEMNYDIQNSGVRVTRSFVLCVCFIDRCLSVCPFSLWPLCCLFVFDLRILITLWYHQTLLNRWFFGRKLGLSIDIFYLEIRPINS